MPWTEADRAKYEVIRARYSSDMSDAEFALISALLPAPKRRGRKPTDPRKILDALFYLIRAGCLWRHVPSVRISRDGERGFQRIVSSDFAGS
ncbi:MAG: transposase [Hyphomicrobiales bacterium]|nr:transposase [Hyphomicrobiales bacterium]